MQRELWAARDTCGSLWLFHCEPVEGCDCGREEDVNWVSASSGCEIMQSLLPDLHPGEKRRVKLVVVDDEQEQQ